MYKQFAVWLPFESESHKFEIFYNDDKGEAEPTLDSPETIKAVTDWVHREFPNETNLAVVIYDLLTDDVRSVLYQMEILKVLVSR